MLGRAAWILAAATFAVAALTAGVASARPFAAGSQIHRCVPGTEPVDDVAGGLAAVAVRATEAYRVPDGELLQRFGLLNVNGVRTVFSVVGKAVDVQCRTTWLHVELPVRPNGATGWMRPDGVRLVQLHTRIVVDLSRRRVSLFRDGRLVLSSPAAVGASATPTPVGRYYVNQRLIPSDPNGPYGPGAVGLSAFSPVLTGWAQGGPIAIHGTNEPWSIGHAVSNGCIRLPNAALTRLFRLTPTGTPVVIRR